MDKMKAINSLLELRNATKTPLDYTGFEKYRIKNDNPIYNDKQQWLFRFDNNYGASVIKHWGSYGWEDDLFELAVIEFDNDIWNLCYTTSITNDVIGHLTNNDIIRYLNKIKNLKEKQ